MDSELVLLASTTGSRASAAASTCFFSDNTSGTDSTTSARPVPMAALSVTWSISPGSAAAADSSSRPRLTPPLAAPATARRSASIRAGSGSTTVTRCPAAAKT